MPAVPKQGGQRTLEDAFTAGALYREAKELKKKALNAKSRIEVNSHLYKLAINFVINTNIFLGMGGCRT